MEKKLRSYVHVYDERGNAHAFGPDDKVPGWAAEQMGDHVWESSDEPEDREVEPVDETGEIGSEPVTDEPEPAEDKSPTERRRGTAH